MNGANRTIIKRLQVKSISDWSFQRTASNGQGCEVHNVNCNLQFVTLLEPQVLRFSEVWWSSSNESSSHLPDVLNWKFHTSEVRTQAPGASHRCSTICARPFKTILYLPLPSSEFLNFSRFQQFIRSATCGLSPNVYHQQVNTKCALQWSHTSTWFKRFDKLSSTRVLLLISSKFIAVIKSQDSWFSLDQKSYKL